MRLVVSEFMSLDGVVQAPGGAEEDTDGRFAHGGWSMPYFDPEVMGPIVGGAMASVDALLFGGRTLGRPWPRRGPGAGRRPLRRPDERHQEIRGVVDPHGDRHDLEYHVAVAWRTQWRTSPRCGRSGERPLVWGSAALVKVLLAQGLVTKSSR